MGKCLQNFLVAKWIEHDVLVASRAPSGVAVGRHVVWDVTQRAPALDACDVIVHAATPASAELNSKRPAEMFWVNVRAMENVIGLAERFPLPPRIVFTSSGGVYGEMPKGLERFPEEHRGAVSPLDPRSAYAEGKRAAEFLLAEATQRGVCVGVVARLFAFSGVHLPLDRHFALGNFVRDAVEHRLIAVTGDGTAVRSYLDGMDMAQWIMRAAEAGEPGFPHHVGSEDAISIRGLAHLVADRAAQVLGLEVDVRVLGTSRSTDGVSRYVPETSLTRQILGVAQTVSIEDSVDQMLIRAASQVPRKEGR